MGNTGAEARTEPIYAYLGELYRAYECTTDIDRLRQIAAEIEAVEARL